MESCVGGSGKLRGTYEKIAQVRNDLAHGNKSWTDQDLLPYLRIAMTLAVGLLLFKLELPDDKLCQAIDQGHWTVFGQ